jgi:hypothetical protein
LIGSLLRLLKRLSSSSRTGPSPKASLLLQKAGGKAESSSSISTTGPRPGTPERQLQKTGSISLLLSRQRTVLGQFILTSKQQQRKYRF